VKEAEMGGIVRGGRRMSKILTASRGVAEDMIASVSPFAGGRKQE